MEREKLEVKEKLTFITAKVVEYLEPLMSRELLCKFPDNTAFDFDYSQSSIWSPLVPRTHSPMDLEFDLVTPRKLTYGFDPDFDRKSRNSAKKRTPCLKKKINVNLNLDILKKKKNKNKKFNASEFSPTPVKSSCVPFPTKGWGKVLKAASKRFKKKKKDPSIHVKLSNYLRDSNI
ncbi:hypothetical protein HS088_TW04G00824 [Tripterygium wilfordii]|uniref:Uncharacterized protein n=1 Tax=Tripterygium wilfordii TaxID=458696 RepID=A0A7J7DRT7_TRIWF|nr:uncharacterized protein LOC119997188 [Tripterygium wilfordii]KAF5748864.1 hypothetical protein HS088_TW04G00824 [Tripterygium wilfordii]